MSQVILLEKIEKLGEMGEVVNVKPGFARNYLLPQNKALRATKDNIAYFEAQKGALEKLNNEKKAEAQKLAKKLDGLKVILVRQASESGQLYGSVTGRDIAENTTEVSEIKIERSMVDMNRNYKTLGLFPVEIALHPEVKVEITINIARSLDEAKIQEKTGKALITDDDAEVKQAEAEEDAREAFMEEDALAAEQAREAEEAAKAEEEAAKTAEKSAARAEKKAAKAEAEAAEAEAETADAEEKTEGDDAAQEEVAEEEAEEKTE